MFFGFIFIASVLVWDPFLDLLPKWGSQLSATVILSYWFFNWLSLSRHVLLPTVSSCFLSRAHCSKGVFIWVFSANQNTLSIHGWYVSIFNPDFLNYFTDEGAVAHSTATSKNLDDQARLVRHQWVDSEVVLKAEEVNSVSSNQRVSGEFS